MLLLFAVVASVVLWLGPAGAVRWEFDDGTTQGWSATEGLIGGGGARETNLFPGEVDEGVWRIAVDSSSTRGRDSQADFKLISPTIGYDSDLFDRVRIRCRTVHHRPTVGHFSISWTNEHNALAAGQDPEDPLLSLSRFASSVQDLVYTTEWQEIVLSLAGQDEKIWEGLLKDIRLRFLLDTEVDLWSAADVVEVAWFEVDWIELIGVEELLQGELPPPYVEYFRLDGIGLFAAPVFYPIAPGIGGGTYGEEVGVLTDLDGDGDLDLFAVWEDGQIGVGTKDGWLMALNDGHGALKLRRVEEVTATGETSTDEDTGVTSSFGVVLGVLGADLTGDGRDEIVLSTSNEGKRTEVWSIGPELQVEVLVPIADRWVADTADWDGDGRVELFVQNVTYEGSTLEVWDAAEGGWTAEEVAADPNYAPARVGDVTGDGALDVVWVPIAGRSNRWLVQALGGDLQQGESFAFGEGYRQLLGVGDFDGDGQVDVLTESTRDQFEGSKGLVWLSKSTGGAESAVLYDDRLFRRSPVLMRDLNGDGVDDWVFIGGDRASGFGVFVEWGGLVNSTQDGERHRLQGSATHVLSGDMDGDGDEDLVVLDPIWGGVHVLKSSLASTATAVRMSAAARPAQYRLGDSYPNPFNPAVVLPLDLATDATEVSLRVHDVLGRRVRQVWQGPLGAGSHRFTWDGRDEAGKSVAAGVYVYRVEMDGQVEAKKTTKLP